MESGQLHYFPTKNSHPRVYDRMLRDYPRAMAADGPKPMTGCVGSPRRRAAGAPSTRTGRRRRAGTAEPAVHVSRPDGPQPRLPKRLSQWYAEWRSFIAADAAGSVPEPRRLRLARWPRDRRAPSPRAGRATDDGPGRVRPARECRACVKFLGAAVRPIPPQPRGSGSEGQRWRFERTPSGAVHQRLPPPVAPPTATSRTACSSSGSTTSSVRARPPAAAAGRGCRGCRCGMLAVTWGPGSACGGEQGRAGERRRADRRGRSARCSSCGTALYHRTPTPAQVTASIAAQDPRQPRPAACRPRARAELVVQPELLHAVHGQVAVRRTRRPGSLGVANR